MLLDYNFRDFANLFRVWFSIPLLLKLDWTIVFEFDHCPDEFIHQKFISFIRYCITLDIEDAKFYLSTKQLFKKKNIPQNISILLAQFRVHIHSYFYSLLFRVIYSPMTRHIIVKELSIMRCETRRIIPDIINLLARFYGDEIDDFMPTQKLYPSTSNVQ